MLSTNCTPSKRIKTLYRTRRQPGVYVSLKDFAVELGRDGSKDERKLVEDWLSAKAGETVVRQKPEPEAKKKVLKKK